jgi:hypothetical protein
MDCCTLCNENDDDEGELNETRIVFDDRIL